jgi:hypothetical protein
MNRKAGFAPDAELDSMPVPHRIRRKLDQQMPRPANGGI